MRIAFFGLPVAALLLHRDGHDIAWAGVCRRSALGVRRLTKCLGRGRVRIEPTMTDASTLTELEATRPDLIVSWFWTKKLPARVLRVAPAFGVHPSLLPRHRGPDPYFWAIALGDRTTGVTAHLLEAEYDTGPILAQREIAIDPGWDAWRLARALDRPSLALLREMVHARAADRWPEPRAQDERHATPAPEPSLDDLAVRWSWSAAAVERRVRAAAPWPGAWTEIGGAIVTLVGVRPTTKFPRTLLPGEAAVRGDGIAVIRAADAAVELWIGRDEDDHLLGAPDLSALVRAAAQNEE